MSEYKIIDVLWLSGEIQHSIGVVAIDSFKGAWKAYIGVQKGVGEESDIQDIAANGTKLPKRIAVAVFPHLDPEEWVA